MGERSKLKLEDIPCMNLGQFVLDHMRRHNRQSIAMVDADTDRNITYEDLIYRTERAASGLQKFGVLKDDVICVVSPNHTDYMVAFYATALITATFQPVNPLYTRDNIKGVVKECKTKFVLTVPEHLSKVEEALAGTGVKPNMLHVVPPVMVMFSKYLKVSEYDLSSIKTVICGAAPLSKEIEEVVKTKLKLPCIIQGYGMTEVGITHEHGREDFRYKSVGKILPLVEMKIVDVETGKTCGLNEEGEIWIKGPQISLGYLNLPEENKRFFTDDGWARTGDIGKEDDDGYLFVVDRLKELILYKGFQVAPATLEDILLTHDDIADVGVIGVPDEEAGELPRAYVVKKAGKAITEAEIIRYVDSKVSPHMKLRGGVEFVSEIPRTLSGKILRKTLRLKAKALSKL